MAKHHKAKPKKAKVVKDHPVSKPEPKASPKAEPWQSIDSAPVLTPVRVQVEGKAVEAILDGHWYACVDGKPVVDHIIYNPTGWMPLK